MDRSARLQSANSWLKTYNGSNIASGYRRHFGVDWICAFRELEMLGVKIDAGYQNNLLKCIEGDIAARHRRKARREEEAHQESFGHDENLAYLAGYTSAGFAYGVPWEEWKLLGQQNSIDPPGGVKTTDELEDIPF